MPIGLVVCNMGVIIAGGSARLPAERRVLLHRRQPGMNEISPTTNRHPGRPPWHYCQSCSRSMV
jgi:hypothetical protein